MSSHGPGTKNSSRDLHDIQDDLSMSMCDFFVLHSAFDKSWMYARSWRLGGEWLKQGRPYSIHRFGWESHYRSFGIAYSSLFNHHYMFEELSFSDDGGRSFHDVNHYFDCLAAGLRLDEIGESASEDSRYYYCYCYLH